MNLGPVDALPPGLTNQYHFLGEGPVRPHVGGAKGMKALVDREERPGVSSHPTTCHSGGTVEVYLEPELPTPLLCLYGDSPVNRALARTARPLGWRARGVAAAGEASGCAGARGRAVVAREPARFL